MTTRIWLRLAEILVPIILAITIFVSWQADRRDRAQLATQLATAQKTIAEATASQHDRDTLLNQTLAQFGLPETSRRNHRANPQGSPRRAFAPQPHHAARRTARNGSHKSSHEPGREDLTTDIAQLVRGGASHAPKYSVLRQANTSCTSADQSGPIPIQSGPGKRSRRRHSRSRSKAPLRLRPGLQSLPGKASRRPKRPKRREDHNRRPDQAARRSRYRRKRRHRSAPHPPSRQMVRPGHRRRRPGSQARPLISSRTQGLRHCRRLVAAHVREERPVAFAETNPFY